MTITTMLIDEEYKAVCSHCAKQGTRLPKCSTDGCADTAATTLWIRGDRKAVCPRCAQRQPGLPDCSTYGCTDMAETFVRFGGEYKAVCSRCAAAATSTKTPFTVTSSVTLDTSCEVRS